MSILTRDANSLCFRHIFCSSCQNWFGEDWMCKNIADYLWSGGGLKATIHTSKRESKVLNFKQHYVHFPLLLPSCRHFWAKGEQLKRHAEPI